MRLTQWRMAKKYGYRRELLFGPAVRLAERMRTCWRGRHQAKMDTRGHCYRCGKAVR